MRRQQKGFVFKASGGWYLKYREDVIKDGKTVRKLRTKRLADVCDRYRTESDLMAEVEKILGPLNSARSAVSNMQLGGFVDNVYLPHAETQLHASTYADYKNKWKTYLKPIAAGLWLRDVRTCDIQRVMNTVARSHDLSKNTLRHIKALLSGIFRFAKQQGHFDGVNPVDDVAVPKGRDSEETHAYSLEEVTRILLFVPEPAATVLATAAFTGLRRSELQGLQWEDYSGDELRVSRAIWNGHINEPKTRKSKAAIPVIPRLKTILERHREVSGKPKTGPIFRNSEKQPICLNNVANRVIIPALTVCEQCKKQEDDHGTEDHDFKRDASRPEWHGYHAFRRGLATNLYRIGTPDKTIQAILRHSNLSVTMNAYVKSVDGDAVRAMNALDQLFQESSKTESTGVPNYAS